MVRTRAPLIGAPVKSNMVPCMPNCPIAYLLPSSAFHASQEHPQVPKQAFAYACFQFVDDFPLFSTPYNPVSLSLSLCLFLIYDIYFHVTIPISECEEYFRWINICFYIYPSILSLPVLLCFYHTRARRDRPPVMVTITTENQCCSSKCFRLVLPVLIIKLRPVFFVALSNDQSAN